MAGSNVYIENYIPAVKEARGTLTKLPIVSQSGVAPVTGGNTAPIFTAGSTTTGTGVGIYWGSGAPTITAPQGSLYLNTTGSSTSTRMYINTTGSTTWTAVTTAA